MSARFLLILIAAGIFGSCHKSDKMEATPKQDFIQLQQVETKIGIIKFEYNQQHQLTKVEQLNRMPDGVSYKSFQYTTFSYTNGQVSKADFFQLSKNQFYKRTEYQYHSDQQKKISSVSRIYYNANGNLAFKDTLDYIFNTDNKLLRVEYGSEKEPIYVLAYNNQGNFVTPDHEEVDDKYSINYKYDFRYDNKINPFAVNGLGLYLFSVYFDEIFSQNQLFSTNNSVYEKSVITETLVDENNQVLFNKSTSFLFEFTNEYDSYGALKLSKMNYTFERKENGKVIENYTDLSDLKYTCVKKQQ